MTRARRLGRRLAAAAAAVSLLTAGCARAEPQPRLAASPELARGGTLTVALGLPGSIDPGNAFEPDGTLVAATMCDSLIGVDPETAELVPALAESWLVTEDGSKIIVKLRKGLRFSDGTPLRATDVVASLSRAASAAFAGNAAELLAPIIGFPAVRGQDPEAEERYREKLYGVTALTETTVQIALFEPLADFVNVLTHPVAAPVRADLAAADPERFETNPVCVGPYRPAEPYDPASGRLRLERVAGYGGWNDTYTAAGRGYADEIVFRFLPQLDMDEPAPAPQRDDGASGDVPRPRAAGRLPDLRGVDVVRAGPSVEPVLRTLPRLKTIAVAGPGIEYIGLPSSAEATAAGAPDAGATSGDAAAAPGAAADGFDPAASAAVPALVSEEDPTATAQHSMRAALSLALDRSKLAAAVYGQRRAPASGFLPPTLGVRAEETSCDATPPTADVAAARSLLSKGRLALQGQELVITYNDDFTNAALVAEVARQWREALGLSVKLDALDWEEYLTTASDVEGMQGPFRFSWSSPYPSADRYLHPLFSTSGIGRTNLSGYSDTPFDEVIDREARRATEAEDRLLSYRRLAEQLCVHLPLIPLLHEQRLWGVATRIVSATGQVAGGPRGEPLLRDLGLPAS